MSRRQGGAGTVISTARPQHQRMRRAVAAPTGATYERRLGCECQGSGRSGRSPSRRTTAKPSWRSCGGRRSPWPSAAGPRAVRPPRRRGVLRRRHDRPVRRGRGGHGDRVAHAGRGRPDPRGGNRHEAHARSRPGQGARSLGHGPRRRPRHVPRPRRRSARGRSRWTTSPRASRTVIDDFRPDVVVTFGPDGGFGHPDHVTSCLATVEAARADAEPATTAARPVPGARASSWSTPSSTGSRPSLERFTGTAGLRPRPQAVRRRHLDARLRRRSPPGRVVPGRLVHHRAG